MAQCGAVDVPFRLTHYTGTIEFTGTKKQRP